MKTPEQLADRIIAELYDFDVNNWDDTQSGVAQALADIRHWQLRQRLVRMLQEELKNDCPT